MFPKVDMQAPFSCKSFQKLEAESDKTLPTQNQNESILQLNGNSIVFLLGFHIFSSSALDHEY